MKSVNEGGLRTRGIRKEALPQKPLVSVITVVLNGEKHLAQTIQSVASQSYENIEYVIIDGGSHDKTLEIIGKYESSIDYWISAPDTGIYDAMNKGIQLSRGTLIDLLNADDYLDPNAVEAVVSGYKKKGSPCIIYGDYFLIDETLGYKVEARSHLNFWLGMTVSHQSMFVHREVYESLGYYDTGYSLASDYDFLLRAINNSVELVHVDVLVVFRRLHGKGGRNFLLSKLETNSIQRKYFKGSLSRRAAFWANTVLDAAKIIVLQGVKLLIGPEKTKRLLMFYYKSRSIKCSLVSS